MQVLLLYHAAYGSAATSAWPNGTHSYATTAHSGPGPALLAPAPATAPLTWASVRHLVSISPAVKWETLPIAIGIASFCNEGLVSVRSCAHVCVCACVRVRVRVRACLCVCECV